MIYYFCNIAILPYLCSPLFTIWYNFSHHDHFSAIIPIITKQNLKFFVLLSPSVRLEYHNFCCCRSVQWSITFQIYVFMNWRADNMDVISDTVTIILMKLNTAINYSGSCPSLHTHPKTCPGSRVIESFHNQLYLFSPCLHTHALFKYSIFSRQFHAFFLSWNINVALTWHEERQSFEVAIRAVIVRPSNK